MNENLKTMKSVKKYFFSTLLVGMLLLVTTMTQGQIMNVHLKPAGESADSWFVDVLVSGGDGYVTNDANYGNYPSGNGYGSWATLDFYFTTSLGNSTAALASAITYEVAG